MLTWMTVYVYFVLALAILYIGHSVSDEGTCFSPSEAFKCCTSYREWQRQCIPCPPGTFGDNCSEVCPKGFFGLKCANVCNCDVIYCDPTNGCKGKDGLVIVTEKVTLPTYDNQEQETTDSADLPTTINSNNNPEDMQNKHLIIVISTISCIILIILTTVLGRVAFSRKKTNMSSYTNSRKSVNRIYAEINDVEMMSIDEFAVNDIHSLKMDNSFQPGNYSVTCQENDDCYIEVIADNPLPK